MNNRLLNKSINNFVNFLNANFELIVNSYKNHEIEVKGSNDFLVSFDEFFDDWAQANWELLVERIVCSPNETISVYGSGSDYEAAEYSRVFFHNAKITHEIACISDNAKDWITGELVDLSKFQFESFVSVTQGWFQVSAPFDHILLSEKEATGSHYQQVVLHKDDVEFIAKVV